MLQPIGQRGVGNAGRLPGRYADYIRPCALALAGEYDERNAGPRRGGERSHDLGQAETARHGCHADDPIGGRSPSHATRELPIVTLLLHRQARAAMECESLCLQRCDTIGQPA